MEKIMTRQEVCEKMPQYTWDLSDIFPSDEKWEEAREALGRLGSKMAEYKGSLSDADKCYDYLEMTNRLEVMVSDLMHYAQRKSDEDTAVAKYQEMCGKIMSDLVSLQGALSFEAPEILAISDEDFEKMFEIKPELEKYRRYLSKLRVFRGHILSEEEEKILSLSGEVTGSAENIYNMFANADMKFEDAVDSEGRAHQLTAGSYISLMQSSDRALRKSAFENVYAAWGKFSNTTAAVLNSQVKSLIFGARARKYENTLEAALHSTEVPTSVYKNLISAVHDNMEPMYKYVALRKKLLGLDELHMYDLYVPVISEEDDKWTFEDAKETVLKALAPLGEEYISLIKKGFNERWIDVYENEGKCSGGYSAGAFCHPYVLLNYDDKMESMFTLAHEMGHALHSYFSNSSQQPVDADYVIFVAEVASTCNEALLMQYLLKNTSDRKKRAYLINYFLEQFRTTLYRQTMFAEFELKINEYCLAGGTLTPEYLCREYHDLNRLYFGEDMVIDSQIDMEWARIPHFYYNYYVYQYATGYSAAIALSQRILDSEPQHTRDYLNFLHEGCLFDPITLLRHAGVDMESPEPVRNALSLFASLVDEMEELTK